MGSTLCEAKTYEDLVGRAFEEPQKKPPHGGGRAGAGNNQVGVGGSYSIGRSGSARAGT